MEDSGAWSLGLSLGYSGARLRIPVERIQLAVQLGYDSVWTAEAYGSDAITLLAWLVQRGYPDVAERVQKLYLAGREA